MPISLQRVATSCAAGERGQSGTLCAGRVIRGRTWAASICYERSRGSQRPEKRRSREGKSESCDEEGKGSVGRWRDDTTVSHWSS